MDPQVAAAMQNPMMRQMLSNPQMLQQMLQQMPQAPIQGQGQSTSQANTPSSNASSPGLDFNSLFVSTPPNAASSTQQPVQQQPQPQAMPNPEVVFADQLRQLQDMGFYDRPSGLRALMATGGNVEAAIERLLGEI